jgi:D-threonate/D-erythronate kinase
MKLAIIADDLTGANDSGVQLAKYGLSTSVFLKMDNKSLVDNEAVVFDTDSRALEAGEAKKRVEDITQFLVDNNFGNIYKKIDSTMRGNIGEEIVGFHNKLKTDFIFVVAAYPKNERTIINGYHYLKNKLLSETEIAEDPVTPVKESHIPTLLKQQIQAEIGHINLDLLHSGKDLILEHLNRLKEKNVIFVVVDAEVEEDLQLILEMAKGIDSSIGWVGSAGLANYLPQFFNIEAQHNDLKIINHNKPILTIVGSVNVNSRKQLQLLLKEKNICGIKMDSFKAVSNADLRKEEMSRIFYKAKEAAKKGLDIVIYSSGEKEDISYAREIGRKNGFNYAQTSSEIVIMIGGITSVLLEAGLFQGVVMTGGDTAKQVCERWDVTGFRLYDELEIGVPISSFIGVDDIFVITKAGGFGKETVFINAIERLRGEDVNAK